ISEGINQFTYQLLDYLETIPWDNDPENPLTRCYLNYCLPTLRNYFQDSMLNEIPEHHKKAIIACHIAAQVVYTKGLSWSPSIVNILPVLLKDQITF
ncbi:MAG: hypothetical protein H0X29_10005, partial [Parachlamydiaceae bacterium]|nr:hypothetical protein [Parachlamydiaceae bacterium]